MKFEHSYKNGNYKVLMFSDGTKVRMMDDDNGTFNPEFSENVDVKITDRCDGGCPFCYEGCTSNGDHADLFSYPFIETLHPYTEMALNGNDLTHPEIERFLEHLKSKKVYANITVNQKHFILHYDKLKDWSQRGLVHGIGVSLKIADDDLVNMMKGIPNTVLHTINGILTKSDLEFLKNKGLKVLVLGYKRLRRGDAYLSSFKNDVEKNSSDLKELLPIVLGEHWFDVISFDNLAIEQLEVQKLMSPEDWESFYMGDDGDFTFYIDMVKGEYGRNSCTQERYPIGDKSIDEMFNHIKSLKA